MIVSAGHAAESDGRLLYLDGMRGLAALVVAVFYHYVHFSNQFQPGSADLSSVPFYNVPVLHTLYVHGALAVDVFFLISGYVFAAVYGDQLRTGRVSGWSFFVRRLARLYPIHVLTLLLSALLVYLFLMVAGRFPVYRNNGPLEFVLNLLFMQSGTLEEGYSFNGPSWSLSFEALAYLLFFFIAVNGMRLRWIVAVMSAGFICSWFGTDSLWRPMVFCTVTGTALIGFFLGVLIHQYGRSQPFLTGLTIAAIGALSLLTASYFGRPRMSVAVTWLVFGLLLLAMQRSPLLRRLFELRVLILLGDLSLAIYLLHFPVQVVILVVLQKLQMTIPLGSPSFLFAYGVAVVATAYCTHSLFELPAQRYLRAKFDRSRRRRIGFAMTRVPEQPG